MKITGFDTFVVGTPWRNLTYLRLETDANIVGWGEARVVGKTHTVREYLRDVRRHIVGWSVFDVEDLYRRFTLVDFGSAGEVVMTGLALVEMACWDCIGKHARLPVYRMLGGQTCERVPAYANGWYRVDRTPEAFAAAAARVVERGYLGLKVDPFGNGRLELAAGELERSVEILTAIRRTIGSRKLYVEMHGRFAPHEAVRVARAIEPLEPAWIEEPCPPEDAGALAHVARHTPIPIATGERYYHARQFRDLFEQRVIAVVQPDLTQCGGILEAKKICSTAETYSLMAAPHNVGGVLTTSASLQLMLTLRNGKVLEHFNDFVDAEIQLAGAPYPSVDADGYFATPQGPGWGVEIDEEFLASRPPTTADGVVLDPGLDMFRKPDWCRRE